MTLFILLTIWQSFNAILKLFFTRIGMLSSLENVVLNAILVN